MNLSIDAISTPFGPLKRSEMLPTASERGHIEALALVHSVACGHMKHFERTDSMREATDILLCILALCGRFQKGYTDIKTGQLFDHDPHEGVVRLHTMPTSSGATALSSQVLSASPVSA